jgi:hypothetical protein
MLAHTKMSIYYISINQRIKSDIDHQNNQPTFLIEKNSFNFVLGFLSLKNATGVGIPRCEILLVLK